MKIICTGYYSHSNMYLQLRVLMIRDMIQTRLQNVYLRFSAQQRAQFNDLKCPS